ncbi:MAG: hypothetical protein AB7T38_11590 [Nitrospirales bacterium]
MDRAFLRHICWTVWLVWLGGCANHPFANLEEWKKIRTANFIFYSNTDETLAIDIAKTLENFRTLALQITTIPPFEEPHPLRVYVFNDWRSFTAFQPMEKVGGYFIQGHNFIAMNAAVWDGSASSIIYHEFIHYLLSKHPARFPQWYDEGLAGIFETFDYHDGTVKFGIPTGDKWLWLLTQPEWISMEQLLLDQVDFLQDQVGIMAHAQSWAMMHYFFFGKEGNFDKLGRYIFLVNDEVSPLEALMAACGLTPEGLFQEVKQYVAQGELDYTSIAINPVDLNPQLELLPVTQIEIKEVLHELLVPVKKIQDHRS